MVHRMSMGEIMLIGTFFFMHICQHICLIRNMNLYPHLCADQECFVLDVGASNVR